MKNILTSYLVTAAILLFSTEISAQEITISKQELPAEINSFVATHFSGIAVNSITKEAKKRKVEYELVLNNGTKLEFDDTKIKEIEGREKLPDALIPKNILSYVQKNYPQNYITEWKRDAKKQQIELDSKVEIDFSLDGQFLKIDD